MYVTDNYLKVVGVVVINYAIVRKLLGKGPKFKTAEK